MTRRPELTFTIDAGDPERARALIDRYRRGEAVAHLVEHRVTEASRAAREQGLIEGASRAVAARPATEEAIISIPRAAALVDMTPKALRHMRARAQLPLEVWVVSGARVRVHRAKFLKAMEKSRPGRTGR